MMQYIHELKDWPRFTWDHKALSGALADVRHRQGRLLGRMEALGFVSLPKPRRQILAFDNYILDIFEFRPLEEV